jgi:hypothetical protein
VLLIKTSAFCWNNNCVIINMHGKTTIKITICCIYLVSPFIYFWHLPLSIARVVQTTAQKSNCYDVLQTAPWLSRHSQIKKNLDSYCVKFIPLNAKLNPTCHLLALLGARHILHVSRVRVKAVFAIRSRWSFGSTCYSLKLYAYHQVVLTGNKEAFKHRQTQPEYIQYSRRLSNTDKRRYVYASTPAPPFFSPLLCSLFEDNQQLCLMVTINGMQEIHPMIYLLFFFKVQSQVIDVWLIIDEVSVSHTATHHSL